MSGIIKSVKVLTVLMCLISISTLGNANTPYISETYTVDKNSSRILSTGMHQFDVLEIKENATLFITGTTTIITEKLIAKKGAKIVYKENSQEPAVIKNFELHALDASQVEFLHVIGNGADGKGFKEIKDIAKRGDNGRNATSPSFKHPKGRKSTGGGKGANGASGSQGENAMNVVLFFKKVTPDAMIKVDAIGGNGGRGQDGGHGGVGGDGSSTRSSSIGGPGGNAGPGSKGGDSGKIYINIVLNTLDSIDDREGILSKLRIHSICKQGEGGLPGNIGIGGLPGDMGGPVKVGERPSGQGRDGLKKKKGISGQGPTKNANNSKWATIDIIDLQSYMVYLTNKIEKYR